MQDLDTLIAFIAEHFRFDADTYPELAGQNAEQRLRFAVRHSALHFAKTAGKIAAVSEDSDHGEELDLEELRRHVPKALINTLRLAELVHLSGDDLVRAIRENYQT